MKNLVEILSKNPKIPSDAIEKVLAYKNERRGSIVDAFFNETEIKEEDILKAVSEQFGIPYQATLIFDNINTSFASFIPIHFLRKFFIVPVLFFKDGDDEEIDTEHSYLAVNNPYNSQEIDDLLNKLSYKGLNVSSSKMILAKKEEIEALISLVYDRSRDSAQNFANNMMEDDDKGDILAEIEQTSDLLDDSSDAPIIKLVNHMISQSIKAKASDIHIEPYQDSFKVRYRVDGILYDLLTPPKWVQSALVSRIKIMANLDIAEKRLPQDGRIEVKIGNQVVDIRVSTIPISFGERVVLRLLDKKSSLIDIKNFGLDKEAFNKINDLIKVPNGIILVTGPTGSGKTTTLYSILKEIHKPEINIITIEDPVEYQIEGIGQIQVNPKIDLTFAKGLRSIVRQDPDVILIGEIRDNETAEIAVQSALTGHLVFSTLHTNDAPSAITRLLDIGIEPFLISSSVNAVLAQRLIRVLCKSCKKEYSPSEKALKNIGLDKPEYRDKKFYKAVGCSKCFNTGYKGRAIILEIMILNEDLKEAILANASALTIKQKAIESGGLKTLRHDGAKKVLQGITTIEEILRVTNL